LITSNIDKK